MKPKTLAGGLLLLLAVAGLGYALLGGAGRPQAGAAAKDQREEPTPSATKDQREEPTPSAPAATNGSVTPAPQGSPLAPLTLTGGKDGLVAYYFHGNSRCKTCLKLEALTRKVLESNFAAELADGRLRFQEVDYDDPTHRHFKAEFKLSFSTVLLARVAGGQVSTSTCEKTWELLYDEFQFETYLVDQVRTQLTGLGGGA